LLSCCLPATARAYLARALLLKGEHVFQCPAEGVGVAALAEGDEGIQSWQEAVFGSYDFEVTAFYLQPGLVQVGTHPQCDRAG